MTDWAETRYVRVLDAARHGDTDQVAALVRGVRYEAGNTTAAAMLAQLRADGFGEVADQVAEGAR